MSETHPKILKLRKLDAVGAFQIVATITNRRQRFQRLTGLGVRCSLRQFEIHPIPWLAYSTNTWDAVVGIVTKQCGP